MMAATAALALAGSALGATAASAAKKKPPCPKFAPVAPTTDSQQADEAVEAPIIKLTDRHTEKMPLVIEYEHGTALWAPAGGIPIQEDTEFFNFQIYSRKPTAGLHLRMEWPEPELTHGAGLPSPSDIDMLLYDSDGNEIDSSQALNAAPVPGVTDAGGRGGNRFESIPGAEVTRCLGYTVESRAAVTEAERMTLRVWLGDVAA
ncbi:MAG: hypothetical protein ABR575_10715 [Actinomycetota bacterium]